MLHSFCFHSVILAYLVFIFSGCGYKAPPFYKQAPSQSQEVITQDNPTQKKILFQGIDSTPSPTQETQE
ncbi:hypothetical protein LS71_003070 [Helicobacter jaachi]|uniref:Lipoprotein n=1 Tax=Helicobacter jaachi TaxID=1677920 RepID=A0A4U8TCP0_9HELI|nr:hypothetical protein [Helicobacter jaachi]TLD97729.1 hypothetical protein LS71_003070 [Helicobacter jaachi]